MIFKSGIHGLPRKCMNDSLDANEVLGSLIKAIKTACTAIRSKMTNPVKSGSSYIETMNTPTYGMQRNPTKNHI